MAKITIEDVDTTLLHGQCVDLEAVIMRLRNDEAQLRKSGCVGHYTDNLGRLAQSMECLANLLAHREETE